VTYIRMTDGRDRGHVLDVPFVDAQAMLRDGKALAVDMSKPDALEFKPIANPVAVGALAANIPVAAQSSSASGASRFKKNFKR
jgi:hypothetical protein